MNFVLSRHVLEELEKRRIPRTLVERVLQAPEQKVAEVENITCYQSRIDLHGKSYLLRVMVNDKIDPARVVTAYITSKVDKYWRKP